MSTCKYTLLFHLRFCLHLETATIGQMCPLAPTADQKVVLQMGLPHEWNTAITVHISCPDYMVHFGLLAPGSSRHCPFPWLSAGCFVLCSQLRKANCTVTLSRTQGNKFNCFKSNAVLLCMKTTTATQNICGSQFPHPSHDHWCSVWYWQKNLFSHCC